MPLGLFVVLASWARGEGPAFLIIKTKEALIYDRVEHYLISCLAGRSVAVINLEEDRQILEARIQEKAPRVIITLGTKATEAVVNLAIDQPVIFSTVLVANEKIQASRAAREGRLFGIELFFDPQTIFIWLKKIFPEVKTVGLLCSPKSCPRLKNFVKKAPNFGLKVVFIEVRTLRSLNQALLDLARQAELLVALPDFEIYNPATIPRIILFSIEHALPLVGISRNYAGAGAVLSLDWDWKDLANQTAELGQMILEGRIPPQPFQPPRTTQPIINIKTARLIGLKMPQKILNKVAVIE